MARLSIPESYIQDSVSSVEIDMRMPFNLQNLQLSFSMKISIEFHDKFTDDQVLGFGI